MSVFDRKTDNDAACEKYWQKKKLTPCWLECQNKNNCVKTKWSWGEKEGLQATKSWEKTVPPSNVRFLPVLDCGGEVKTNLVVKTANMS